jgi:cytochrome c2
LCVIASACSANVTPSAAGGNVERGKQLAGQYGCAACHAIPDMPIAGMVGPPLNGVAKRAYLAGVLPNTPENMVHWIRFPHQVTPNTMMPELGVSEADGRDLTAFLYGLP